MHTRLWGKCICSIIIFTIIWCIFLPLSVRHKIQRTFFEIQAPLLATHPALKKIQSYWTLNAISKDKLVHYYRELARENAYLQLRIKEQNHQLNLCQQVVQLKNMPPPKDYYYVIAHVSKRSQESWNQTLVINRGYNDGIREGQGVLCNQGIVGRITQVYRNNANVELISNPQFKILGHLDNANQANTPLLIQTHFSKPFKANKAYVEDLTNAKDLTLPCSIKTLGLGDQFPEDVYIGSLVKIKEKNGNYQGTVRLGSYLNHLEEVSVLIPLAPNYTEK